MTNYIDGFVLPIKKQHLETYKKVAEKVAGIWKEYGAISYQEFISDDLLLEGTKSFVDALNSEDDDVIIFGWVAFPSKEIRDEANKKVPLDSRMQEIVAPLVDPNNPIFDASKMVYGGFKTLVQQSWE